MVHQGLTSRLQGCRLHAIQTLHQQLELAIGLGLGSQGHGLGQRQGFSAGSEGFAGVFQFSLQGLDASHDLRGLRLEPLPQFATGPVPGLDVSQHGRTSHCFNAADARGHATLRYQPHQTDFGSVVHVGAAAELHGYTRNIHHPHHVPVLLPEHGHSPTGLGLCHGHLAHLQAVGIQDPAIDQGLHLLHLTGRHRSGAVEIKAEPLEVHQRTCLGDAWIHNPLECLVEEMGGRVMNLSPTPIGAVHPGGDHVSQVQHTRFQAALVQNETIHFLHVLNNHLHGLTCRCPTQQQASISHLTSGLPVEASAR